MSAEPSVYERIQIFNRRSEYLPVGETIAQINACAEWVRSKGTQVDDVGIEGFRFRNPGDGSRWYWANTGQWMHFYDDTEFDHPADSAPWNLSDMDHLSGPDLLARDDGGDFE